MLFAHGVGTRSDLPVSLAVIGAGMALMISFVVLPRCGVAPACTAM